MNRVSLINKPVTTRQQEIAIALALEFWRSERARRQLAGTTRPTQYQPTEPEPLPPSPNQ